MVPPELPELRGQLSGVATACGRAGELQEISRGITGHPRRRLAAPSNPARRSAVTRRLEWAGRGCLTVEVPAYYIVSEALTNAASTRTPLRCMSPRSAHESSRFRSATMAAAADPARGSGLIGLTDRVDRSAGRSVATPSERNDAADQAAIEEADRAFAFVMGSGTRHARSAHAPGCCAMIVPQFPSPWRGGDGLPARQAASRTRSPRWRCRACFAQNMRTAGPDPPGSASPRGRARCRGVKRLARAARPAPGPVCSRQLRRVPRRRAGPVGGVPTARSA